ncbi:MAG: hypothetical protein ACI8ZB_004335 [Desulforhopalus sp.]|jgi:hypothetical protein
MYHGLKSIAKAPINDNGILTIPTIIALIVSRLCWYPSFEPQFSQGHLDQANGLARRFLKGTFIPQLGHFLLPRKRIFDYGSLNSILDIVQLTLALSIKEIFLSGKCVETKSQRPYFILFEGRAIFS